MTRKLKNTLDVLVSLVTDPTPLKLKVLEICTWTGNVTSAALKRGWETVPSVSLETG